MPLTTSIPRRKAYIQKTLSAVWHIATFSDGVWYTQCGFSWSLITREAPLTQRPPDGHICANCYEGD